VCVYDRTYQDRIYTTNAVGFANIKHIRSDGSGRKDYSQVIQQAMELPGFTQSGVQTKVTVSLNWMHVVGLVPV
jgi:hydroxylamine reductase